MSKPKAIRSCAFCGLKTEKSKLLRINLPDLSFDFFQNKNYRSFYVCQNAKCIHKVLKKYAVAKHLKTDVKDTGNILLANIEKELSFIIADLFNKGSLEVNNIKDYTNLILCKKSTCLSGENVLSIGENLYRGSVGVCVVSSKAYSKLLMNYRDIITYIDGLMEN